MTQEQLATVLTRVQKLVPEESDTALLTQLIEDAESYALAYTGRTEIIDLLLRPVGDLAVWAYNRLGTEGDAARSEGGESYTFEAAPHRIYSILDMYRLARVGGKRYEQKTQTDQV